MKTRMNIALLMITVCVFAFGILLHAQDSKKPAEEEANQTLETKIKELIGELGAQDFEARQTAINKLIEIGEPSLTLLRKTQKESEDPEVLMNIKHIIAKIEVLLPVKNMAKNWSISKEPGLWYYFSGRGKEEGVIYSMTKDDKYNKEDVLRMEDIVIMNLMDMLTVFTATSFCRIDENLPIIYGKTDIKLGDVSRSVEYWPEKDKMKVIIKANGKEEGSEAIPIGTNNIYVFNTLARYVTLLPFQKGYSAAVDFLKMGTPDPVMTVNISYVDKGKITVGKDEITAHKFKFESKNMASAFFWVNEKRLLVKLHSEDELDLILVSKEEAGKKLAELKEKLSEKAGQEK